jgi:putative ABC transport system substrate-binding protein
MQSRHFITLLAGVAVGLSISLPAAAQAPALVGFLNGGWREHASAQLAAFHRGLREVGCIEGRNIALEYRFAEGRYERLPVLAAELVHSKAAAIVATGGSLAARAAQAESPTTPIVLLTGFDPSQLDAVGGISRAAGNVTGVSLYTTPLAAKRLEFLRELVPGAARIGVLVNPTNASAEIEARDLAAAIASTGARAVVLRASTDAALAPAFAAVAGIDALMVSADPFLNSRREQLAALAERYRVPAIYPWRENVEAGGLMSYGPRLTEAYREIGRYTGRILKGTAPADLPIQVPRKFELVINLRTAAALGVTIPQLLLARADEAIE